jgi:hypothetical protein
MSFPYYLPVFICLSSDQGLQSCVHPTTTIFTTRAASPPPSISVLGSLHFLQASNERRSSDDDDGTRCRTKGWGSIENGGYLFFTRTADLGLWRAYLFHFAGILASLLFWAAIHVFATDFLFPLPFCWFPIRAFLFPRGVAVHDVMNYDWAKSNGS